jgi:hypothetical protein
MWRSNKVIALVNVGQVEVVDFKLFFSFQKSIITKMETVLMF